jgi:hypothetical protein
MLTLLLIPSANAAENTVLANPLQESFLWDMGYLVIAFIIALIVGIPIYDKFMTRGVSLNKALFEEDNPVAGLEVGGIMLAFLYIAYNATAGEPHSNVGVDILAALLAFFVSVILLLTVRGILSSVVKKNNDGKDLNDEIFNQRNPAAAAVSLSLVMCIAVGISKEDFLGETPLEDGLFALTTLTASMLSVFIYRFSHLRGKPFLAEFFHNDNPAAGISLLAYSFGACFIAFHVCDLVVPYNMVLINSIGTIVGFSIGGLFLLMILRHLFLLLLGIITKSDIHDEIYNQKNVGAGFIDAGITVGISLLLMGTFV